RASTPTAAAPSCPSATTTTPGTSRPTGPRPRPSAPSKSHSRAETWAVAGPGLRPASDGGAALAALRLPGAAGGALVLVERSRPHGDAVAGGQRSRVAPFHDPHRVHEVLVQVVHVLADAVLEGGAQRDVVEDGQVLDVLAEADAAR